MAKITRLARLSTRVIRDDGLRSFLGFALTKVGTHLLPPRGAHGAMTLVDERDARALDWTQPAPHLADPVTVTEGPVDIAWIMSPPGLGSGGHQNIFRFINFAEQAGHRCTIYLYTTDPLGVNLSEVKAMLARSEGYSAVSAAIRVYDRRVGVEESTQAIFATGWETAYPAYLDRSTARRFYFVQDFEPSFYETGTQSVLAENTYRFGFHGMTAGGWISHKLRAEYGMECDHFDFSVDTETYWLANRGRRREVFFYARPVTARRGFDLGIMVLAELHEMDPDIRINLAGWDVGNYHIPFPHRNLGTIEVAELNAVYNRSAAGLVLSLTNMSLLPLELIASGTIPVVNDGPNNRMVSENPFIEYGPPIPAVLARKLRDAVYREDAPEHARAAADTVRDASWSTSGHQFLEAFARVMRGER